MQWQENVFDCQKYANGSYNRNDCQFLNYAFR